MQLLETKLVLHYSQTYFCFYLRRFRLETKLVLHYSQTRLLLSILYIELETKLVLHYSQTTVASALSRCSLETKLVLHYSQTPNCIFTQNAEFKDLRDFSAYEAGVILVSQLKHA